MDLVGEILNKAFITKSTLPLKFEHIPNAHELGEIIILPTTEQDGIVVLRTALELEKGQGISVGGLGIMVDASRYNINVKEGSVVNYPANPDAMVLDKLN